MIVEVPPGAPCPLIFQRCGGGSTCQYTLNLAVCTCPGGQTACNGVCQAGGCNTGAVAIGGNSGCVIGAGDWCGPASSPRCNCVAGKDQAKKEEDRYSTETQKRRASFLIPHRESIHT